MVENQEMTAKVPETDAACFRCGAIMHIKLGGCARAVYICNSCRGKKGELNSARVAMDAHMENGDHACACVPEHQDWKEHTMAGMLSVRKWLGSRDRRIAT